MTVRALAHTYIAQRYVGDDKIIPEHPCYNWPRLVARKNNELGKLVRLLDIRT